MSQKGGKQKTATVATAQKGPQNYRWLLLLIGTLIITFCSLYPVTKNSFINQDDNIYIFDNPHLSKPLPESVPYFFEPHYFSGNYVPLTMIAYYLVCQSSGPAPESYHALSLFMHLVNVLLVFWFIYLLSRRKAIVAAIVALFFGIHPMHVESVAWASELKDLLYTSFFIAGLIAYLRYIGKGSDVYDPIKDNSTNTLVHTKNTSKDFPALIPVFIFFILSVLSKPAAIIFPFVLLLIDFYTYREFNKKVWLEKIPFIIVSLVFGLIAIKAQQADNLVNEQYSFLQKLIFAPTAALSYLAKFLLPVGLSSFYPYPLSVDGHLPYLYYIAPVAFVLLCYGVYRTTKYTRLVAFGFLFFLVNIFLVLQFIALGNAIIADRYTYVAYIGLIFIIAMGFDRLFQNTGDRSNTYKNVASTIVIVLAIASSFLTYARTQVWATQDTLSDNALENFPNDPIVLNNKGYLLLMEGGYEKSIAYLTKAIQLNPDYTMAYANLINSYIGINDLDHALHLADTALNHAPQNSNILTTKGYLLYTKHEYHEAIATLIKAITLKKDNSKGYMYLSLSYAQLEDNNNAIATLDSGLKYDPGNYTLLNNKGYILYLMGRYNEAIACLSASLKSNPDYTTASANLANCYRAMADTSKAKN